MNLLTVEDFRKDLNIAPQGSFILFFVEKDEKLVPIVPKRIENGNYGG